ncbi:hypothetical protein BVX99_02890 [bacterium F16]|nr:hypothetical protein BVX99_02890 [bacterium F16]
MLDAEHRSLSIGFWIYDLYFQDALAGRPRLLARQGFTVGLIINRKTSCIIVKGNYCSAIIIEDYYSDLTLALYPLSFGLG